MAPVRARARRVPAPVGAVAIGALKIAAARCERPSEISLLFSLAPVTGGADFLGFAGGVRYKRARLAERLAREDDRPSPELTALGRDVAAAALSWGSGAAVVAILVQMIWKPGAR